MSQKSSGPSQRQLRVAEQLRHSISETLRRGHFRNEALLDSGNRVTVTEVRISPDLKNATAYVMTLGGQNIDETLPALNDAAAYFQKEINSHTNLKFTPKVRFKKDETFDEVTKIDNILKNL